MDFLEQLSNADAIAGQEDEVRQLMIKKMNPNSNNVFCDKLGSLIVKKQGKSEKPKIMFAAHMDEVGFVVKSISEYGQIFVKPTGKVLPLSKFLQSVRITTSSGKKISGYLNSTFRQNEDLTEVPTKTYVDVGAKSDVEVSKLGIEIGDMITFDSKFDYFADRDIVFGKAFDDRIGLYIISKVYENLKFVEHANSIYFAATSSEEVGLRGARTCTNAINPDVAFVIDCCSCRDPFDSSNINTRKLGKGVILHYSDRDVICNRYLVNLIRNTAKQMNINLQLDMLERGASDAANIQYNSDGVPVVSLCVPLRYGHCSHSMAHKKDIEDAIALITKVLTDFDKNKFNDCISFI